MRPWLILAAYGVPFEETVVPLRHPGTAEEIRKWSGAAKVPVLRDGALIIWDSLAICEYLAEEHPDLPLWPADPADRAVARAITAEMHSGFQPLRSQLPMNMGRKDAPFPVNAELQADLDRLTQIFAAARGPYLFGADFGIVDAFFCPVASRLHTYGIPPLPAPMAQTYLDTLRVHPAYQRWDAEAAQEIWVIEDYETAGRVK